MLFCCLVTQSVWLFATLWIVAHQAPPSLGFSRQEYWSGLPLLSPELPHDPTIPLLGINLKKMKTLFWKDICTPMFITALFTIAKIWKQSKCPPTDEWIKQLWCTWKWKSFSRVWLLSTQWTAACQAPLSMELSKQEYWSGWPFPSPGDLPNPEIEPQSSTLQADSLPSDLLYTHTHTIEYYSAIKKNEILPFATTCVDLEGIMLNKISQIKTNTVCCHLYVESKK